MNLNGTFSHSEAAFDPIDMPVTPERLAAEELIHAAQYDYSVVSTYSDLDYDYLNLRIGAEYSFSSAFGFTFDIDYYDLSDNQGYIYGVESGSFYVIRTGFRISRFGR